MSDRMLPKPNNCTIENMSVLDALTENKMLGEAKNNQTVQTPLPNAFQRPNA